MYMFSEVGCRAPGEMGAKKCLVPGIYRTDEDRKDEPPRRLSLPDRERTEGPSCRHAVDDHVIHRKYVLAFDREHDPAVD